MRTAVVVTEDLLLVAQHQQHFHDLLRTGSGTGLSLGELGGERNVSLLAR